jgi:hypothetical protein
MPDLSPDMHHRILRALDDALQDVQSAAEISKATTGRVNFQQQVEDRLKAGRRAVEQSKDRAATVSRLTALDQRLRLLNTGPLASAVTRTRAVLAQLLQELERVE